LWAVGRSPGSLLFKESRHPGPMPSKPFIGSLCSSVDVPRRPWPSLRRYCSRASKGGHYRDALEATGGRRPRRRCLRCGALLKRGLYGRPRRRCLPRCGALLKRVFRVPPSWPWSGSSNGVPRPGAARELPFKSHFKGEAKAARKQRHHEHAPTSSGA
jgi:hypothetical protein